MKFNMIFKKTKEFIMKHWLQIIGWSTLLVMIIGIVSKANTNIYEIVNNEVNNHHKSCQEMINFQQQEIDNLTKEILILRSNANNEIISTEKKNNDIILKKRQEYPIATKVWEFLGAYGYNDYVRAGILGNMMAECGGQTLSLKLDAYNDADKGYYGVCQWSLRYAPQLYNTDLVTQLQYLVSSMKQEFNNYGKNYKNNFNYDSFINMTDEEEAALAFAKCYERCASGSYLVRQSNAKKAYEYYTS